MDLFAPDATLRPIPLEDGELAMLSQLPLAHSNESVLAQLIAETDWRADSITLWGKSFLQPRLTAWHGDARYRYSGLTLDPLPWTPLLAEIRAAVEAATGRAFNSVLLNYYRNERDSMGMHSDDEAELGPAPAIGSVSFGATRTLILRHKASKRSLKIDLTDGSLLLMAGNTQANWQHGINKSTRPLGPRVNLTFRFIA
ncbi:alpha-ketoglutarate-dependent dioxygenase AlkB [Massilia sp. CF038]|uniref:alpha-ketoglutarate-dependent dioxygenase AlkB family protein n=1 Tax=Massilia sp. CF038 TaxID=1881045 RepID=UPI0009107159|nr:alpha-ketoglutarate-dependent dioxygenase AlkB [Massilia sp. CF038]SHH42768.1 Alkylated DNA repair dioxygenase AlkB [Massilia sp. CF038]